jgi:hypothetical protein
MTCKINADTTNGLKLTSDTSGEIDLQIDASTKVHMASDGKLGIGTSSPSALLDVVGSGAGTLAEFRDGVASNFIIETSSNVTTVGNQAGSSQLAFKSSNSEAMRIDSSGNVGIGTSSPSTYGGILNLTDGSVGGETTFVIANNNANQFIRLGVKADEAQIAYDNADSLVFGESTDSTTSGITTERMRINSSGNVGIGTTSPSQKLDVNGTINATAFTGDGSSLTGISTPITKSEVIYHSTSTVSSGSTQITLFQEFKYPSNGKISGTFNKQSASTTMVVYFHYCARATSGNPHTFAMWCDAGNNTSLFRATHFDPYHMSQSQVNATWCARWTGLSAGNHTFNCAMGRGDTASVQYVVNFNENSYDGLGINTNGYSMIYAMEIE